MTAGRLPRTAAILGGGAVGAVLLPALRTIGVRVVAAWSRSPRTPQWRGGMLPRAMREAELILLSVSDSAIEPLCAQLVAERLVGPGQLVAHLAGALDLKPLASALAVGAKVGSMHPLRAIPPGSRADAFAGAAAGIEGSDDDIRSMLTALASSLNMMPLAAAGSRALYHAAAVLAAGGQVALFSEAVRAFMSATGASEPEARAALLPLAKGAIETLEARDPSQVITGPIPRGDAETVATHLKALDSHDASTAAIYRQLSQAAVELTRKSARATTEQLAPVDKVLLSPSAAAAPPAKPPAKSAPPVKKPAKAAHVAKRKPVKPVKAGSANPAKKLSAKKSKPAAARPKAKAKASPAKSSAKKAKAGRAKTKR